MLRWALTTTGKRSNLNATVAVQRGMVALDLICHFSHLFFLTDHDCAPPWDAEVDVDGLHDGLQDAGGVRVRETQRLKGGLGQRRSSSRVRNSDPAQVQRCGRDVWQGGGAVGGGPSRSHVQSGR